MRNKSLWYLLFTSILGPCYSTAQSRKNENTWSGYIRYVHTTETSSRNGSGQTTWTMEAVVTKGKAKTFSSEKVTASGDCSRDGYQEGHGETDFPDIYINEDGRFSIELSMPFMKGTLTTDCYGPRRTEKIFWNELALLAEDLKAGDNPDVLVGDSSSVETSSAGGGRSVVTVQISWNLTRGPVDLELIVTPLGYNDWLPIPGKTETETGNQLLVGLDLQDKNGGPPSIKAKIFEISLVQTSKLKGVTINMPLKPSSDSAYDLALQDAEDADITSDKQKMKLTSGDGKSGSFAINSYDGAGTTTLVVEAVLQNGKRVRGTLLKPGGETDILIPKRHSGSRIGEAWAKKNGNPAENSDSDKSMGNTNDGDGLSAFDEYRGVFSEGKFMRLDPRKKELGVQFIKAEKELFREGILLLTKVSGVEVISLYEDELDTTSRTLNRNSETGSHRQKAMRLVRKDDTTGVLGYNDPRGSLNKTPQDSRRVVINVQAHEEGYRDQLAVGAPIPYTLKENIAVTVAHELAHGIGVDHHGDRSAINPPSGSIEKQKIRVIGYNDKPLPDSMLEKGTIGKAGNDASGDLSCIMAYTNYYNWVHYTADGLLFYKLVPLMDVGNKLCTAGNGTGINSGGKYFGDAKSGGNCLGDVKVRDD